MRDGAFAVWGLFWLATCFVPPAVQAQSPLAPAPVVEAATDSKFDAARAPFTPSPEFQAWLTNLVRQHLPEKYEKRKNWGHTARRMSGLSVQLDDWRLKTHRKFSDVNDGRWTMYSVKLADQEEPLDIEVSRIEELPDGRVAMDLVAAAKLAVSGRQSLWTGGVQVYSLSAEADARVQFAAHVEVATRLDPTVFPPDVHLVPTITEAKLEILDFRLRRISRASGPLIRSLSHSVREMLEDKLAEDNDRLVAKMNKSIAKEQDKLKLSLTEMMRLDPRQAAKLDGKQAR